MYTKAIFASALVGLATAAPFEFGDSIPLSPKVKQTADFDDLTALPAVPLQAIGEYKDLYYSGQLLTNFGVAGIQVAGVIPHSGDQVSGTGLQGQVLAGRTALLANYDESETQSFDLKKFYYACALNTVESAASVPTSCTITASGFDKQGNGVATQQFTFTANGLLQNMNEGVFNKDFKNLDHVEFDTDATVSELVATLFDSFEYSVTKKN